MLVMAEQDASQGSFGPLQLSLCAYQAELRRHRTGGLPPCSTPSSWRPPMTSEEAFQ